MGRIAVKRYLLTLAALALAFGCTRPGPKPKAAPFTPSDIKVEVKSGGPVILTTSAAEFQVQPSGYIQAFLLPGEHPLTLDEPRLGAPTDSNYVIRGDKELHFTLAFDQTSVLESVGQLGPGKRVEIPGHPLGPSGTTIDAVLTLEAYDAFPNLLLSTVAYKNTGSDSLAIDRAIEQEHRFNAHLADSLARPWDMWSFQGSRYDAPEDDVFRLTRTSASRSDEDTLVKSGFAGGIPVVAFWTGSVGEAIGHVETAAAPASLRFRIAPDERVIAQLNIPGHLLQPGETFSGPRSFLAVYSGDFYQSLRMWSGLLQKEGSTLAIPSPEAYSAGWSGYESSVTPGQMLGAIAGLKGLGIRRATLDGRWFEGFGDWNPRPDTYPGDAIKQLTAAFHKQSLLDLAWLPLGVEDGQAQQGSHAIAGIVQQHPDWLVLDQDGQHARTKRGLALLCPAVPAVQAYYGQLVEKFIRDWDFDGLQLDAIARVPWCYNPAHHHSSPEDSVNAMVDVYKVICQTAHALKPLSVSQECPCGASPSLASLRFLDQIAAGETATAAQLRRRIKMYKALFGPAAPVYAAEGELSAFDPAGDPRRESGEDLAAIIGTGGVVGVGFDLLQPNAGSGGATARRNEVGAKKWIALYNHNMLSKGSFLDLYTYGYDVPEGYAIAKDGNMYYAFFAPKEDAPWRGQLQLRGLKPGRYQVTDYDRGRSYGTVESGIGKTPHLAVDFTGHLLLVARP
jgi:alpha-galactosidase